MEKIEFRKLVPGDIEIRPATIKDGKATLLTYIDSRSVVELLDKAVGPMNWNMEFEQVGDQMVGKLGIWDETKNTWVVKSDTGSESNIEAGKGLISDIYKRCIARWGLQDLYTVPRIVVDDDGYGCKWKVGEISWNDNRECTHITLVNKFGKVMYTWDKDGEVKQDDEVKPVPNQSRDEYKSNCDILKEWCSVKKQEDDVDKGELLRFYQFYSERCCKWPNRVRPEILWEKWQKTKYN